MKTYKVKLTGGVYGSAVIEGLEDVYLHFASLDFDVVWNKATKRQETVRGVIRYFGGMGEGSEFKTWQDAIHASLYDAFQCHEEFDGSSDGDSFVAEFNGETAVFEVLDKVHIVPRRA